MMVVSIRIAAAKKKAEISAEGVLGPADRVALGERFMRPLRLRERRPGRSCHPGKKVSHRIWSREKKRREQELAKCEQNANHATGRQSTHSDSGSGPRRKSARVRFARGRGRSGRGSSAKGSCHRPTCPRARRSIAPPARSIAPGHSWRLSGLPAPPLCSTSRSLPVCPHDRGASLSVRGLTLLRKTAA